MAEVVAELGWVLGGPPYLYSLNWNSITNVDHVESVNAVSLFVSLHKETDPNTIYTGLST